MKFTFWSTTNIGKWSAGLFISFLLPIIVFFIFMLFGLVTFDQGHWWDLVVGITVPLVISAFITGIVAVRKHKDCSISVYISIFITTCSILFLLLHGLFIND